MRRDACPARPDSVGFSSASLRPTFPRCEVQFDDLRRVPQRHISALAVRARLPAQSDMCRARRCSRRDRTYSRSLRSQHRSAAHRRTGCRRPAAFPPGVPTTAIAAGNGTPLSPSCSPIKARLVACGKLLQRQLDESLRRDLPVAKLYTTMPFPVSPCFSPRRISHRTHAGVNVAAVCAECQPGVERLLRLARQGAVVGKIGHLARSACRSTASD